MRWPVHHQLTDLRALAEGRLRVDRRPSPTTANRHPNLRLNHVQIARCRVAAPAAKQSWTCDPEKAATDRLYFC